MPQRVQLNARKSPQKRSQVKRSISAQGRQRKAAQIRQQAQSLGLSHKGLKKHQVLRKIYAHRSHASTKGHLAAFRQQSARARQTGAKSFVYTGNGMRYTRSKVGNLIVYRASPKHRASQQQRLRSAARKKE